MSLLEQRAEPVVAAGMRLDQRLQACIRRLHRRNVGLGRALGAEIEVIDVHVVVVERPAGRLRFRVIRVAVGGVQPGAADVERHAERRIGRPRPPADAVQSLNEVETPARPPQLLRGGQTGRSGAHDHNVDILQGRHPPRNPQVTSLQPFDRSEVRAAAPASPRRIAWVADDKRTSCWHTWPAIIFTIRNGSSAWHGGPA